jgi:predicted dehydrogenase
VSYQVPMDRASSFDGAAQDFIDSLLQGRQPAQEVQSAKKMLQVALAIYQSSRLERPVAPEPVV